MSPRIGPPPPLDAQLAARLQAILDNLQTPLTPELIADRRARTVAGSLTDDAIRRGGAFDLHERVVAGPPGAPDVNLLICRPTGTVGPHPVIYNTHGGGMVAGNNRTIELADELDRAQELKIAVVAVDYRLAPEHRHPALTAAPRRLAYTSSKAASTAASSGHNAGDHESADMERPAFSNSLARGFLHAAGRRRSLAWCGRESG